MLSIRKSFFAAATLLGALALPQAGVSHAAPTAADVPGGPFATAFRVQNLENTAATCSYQIFPDGGGAATFTASLPAIAPNDSAYVYTPTVADFPSGTFNGVISCDKQVAAVVNFSDPDKGDVYVGSTNPSPTVFIPSAYRNYFNYYTTIRIQNTSNTAQTVTVDYFAPGSAAPVASTPLTLQGNGAATVDQSAVPQLAQNVSYSAKITGSAPLAATVSIFGSGSVAKQLYAFSGFGSGSTTPIYAPVIMRNYYGYNTATTIQNVGTTTASARLTYSNGTVKTFDIPVNSSQVVLDFNEPTLERNVLYSATIQSLNGQPLIVTVNESTPTTSRATTYEGVAAGGRTVVAPIVMKRYFKYNTSVTCQNLGAAATPVRITYSGTGIVNKVVAGSVAPGQTTLIYQPIEDQLPNGYIGSATISADQNIACVVNEDQNEAPDNTQVKDQLYGYDTIVKP